jgi:Caspase domain
VNGQEVPVQRVDPERRTVRLLGAGSVLRQGANAIGDLRFWLEEQRLSLLPRPYPRSYAVLVAIDDYGRTRDPRRRGSTGFAPLESMVARAEELQKTLLRIGFPKENIVTLYEREATSERMNQELQRFWQGGDRADADRLFVYFGGHGAGTEGQGYLVTYDFDPKRPTATGFLMSDVVGRHFPNVQARHLLVALDACSSGLAIPGMRSLGGTDEEKLRQFRRLTVILGDTREKARNLLVAGTQDQKALYVNGGIFTRALIDGLNGQGDLNRDGIVQFEELALQVRNQVRATAAQTGVLQEPSSLVSDAWGHGRVLFFVP